MLNLVNADKFKNADSRSEFITLNTDDVYVQISNYGARVVSLFTKDKSGNFEDIVLGCDQLIDYYIEPYIYMGATIGRYANRISNAKFSIDDKDYFLDVNEGRNHLHGGFKGFHAVWWELTNYSRSECTMTHISADGDQGYPGKLVIELKYRLVDNELKVSYKARTTETTHVNLCHHSYFNLNGPGKGNVLSHKLTIDADFYLPVDNCLIPYGKPESVIDSRFDFRTKSTIGKCMGSENDEFNGYDHSWVLNNPSIIKSVARVEEVISGRTLEVRTSEPALHFYTAKISCKGKSGVMYNDHSAFCLETQHFPNSPNESSYPSTLLHPGEEYSSSTIYRFGTV